MAKLKLTNETLLKDALYNLAGGTGATLEYRIGLVVGVVSTLNAGGLSFTESMETVARLMPDRGHLACPTSWASDLKNALSALHKTWCEPI